MFLFSAFLTYHPCSVDHTHYCTHRLSSHLYQLSHSPVILRAVRYRIAQSLHRISSRRHPLSYSPIIQSPITNLLSYKAQVAPYLPSSYPLSHSSVIQPFQSYPISCSPFIQPYPSSHPAFPLLPCGDIVICLVIRVHPMPTSLGSCSGLVGLCRRPKQKSRLRWYRDWNQEPTGTETVTLPLNQSLAFPCTFVFHTITKVYCGKPYSGISLHYGAVGSLGPIEHFIRVHFMNKNIADHFDSPNQ